MLNVIFVTGIGTDVGKTVASAVLCEALEADYWKPVQAGFDDGTDATLLKSLITNKKTVVHPETYKFKLASSPHISARKEGIKIELDKIVEDFLQIQSSTANRQSSIIIEGAGGLMVPLNDNEFIIDLIKKLNAKAILVSKNYLGSINHSLLTASVCKQNNIDVLGWMFNEDYMNYEEEIEAWTGYTKIATVPTCEHVNANFIQQQALLIKHSLQFFLQ
jgi:dethiobiotin synthetase